VRSRTAFKSATGVPTVLLILFGGLFGVFWAAGALGVTIYVTQDGGN